MGKHQITCVIAAKNEASVIEDALKSVSWCDFIIHVDNGSTDQTIQIVKANDGKTVKTDKTGYEERKNIGLDQVKTTWVLFLDADERITPLLRQEIEKIIKSINPSAAYEIPRRNIYLGREMKYGGWGDDFVIRLFQTQCLKGWKGSLHEQPEFSGELGKLENEIVHFSHRDLESMVEKTIVFTEKESQLRVDSNHPPVSWWRFFRVMATEFWYRFVKLEAWKDGPEGIIDGLFQVYNMFIIYARVWESQNQKK